jgi:hypothetical protein
MMTNQPEDFFVSVITNTPGHNSKDADGVEAVHLLLMRIPVAALWSP